LKFARFIADLLEQLWNEDTLLRLEVEPSSSRLWRGGQLVTLDLDSIQFTYFSHIIAVTSWSADSYKYVARPAPSHTPILYSFIYLHLVDSDSFVLFVLAPFYESDIGIAASLCQNLRPFGAASLADQGLHHCR
jgi:hypothetical protein